MYLDIREVKFLKNYTLEIVFENGEKGQIDLGDYVKRGGVFSHLADPAYFKRVYVNEDIGTICWPDGVDIAPETLYKLVKEKSTTSGVSK